MRDGLTGTRGYYNLLNDYQDYVGENLYVMLCDVDNFRMINDAYGENTGNGLLKRIGEQIVACFGDEHTFRYGSDEFVVADFFASEQEFQGKIAELSQHVSHIDYDGKPLHLTCSYGYAYGAVHTSEDLHEAVRFADRKMYEAKRLGKARAVGSPLTGDPRHMGGLHFHGGNLKSYEVDELTGLSNLIHFRGVLEDRLAMLEPGQDADPGSRLALVYFNIENFKAYNQRFGFDAGDLLLLSISDAIEVYFSGCLSSRFSADQFMVATTQSQVIKGIEGIRALFRKHIKDSSIWLRAGYYLVAHDDRDPGVVCDRAKSACDAVKGRRDKFYNEYDEDLREKILLHRYVLDNFEEALEQGWIKPFYQPIIRVATGEVCDVEALARWTDPQQGTIPPADFVPVLEDARLIHLLDLQIIRRVCEDCARVVSLGSRPVAPSINLSRLDFELCDIVAEVEAILDDCGMDYRMLSIEITESALSGNQEFLKSEVDRFRADGFEVWMDDFGSGYSSLNVLKDYKFDMVKVDMEFLHRFEEVEEARIMLAHVINLAKELGLQTLVEGVESREQFDYLRSLGCGRAQGYYLGKPADLEASIQRVRDGAFPEIEILAKREFYNAVSRINLMRPDPHESFDGHYLPSDTAAAIVRRRAGRYEYLNTTARYEQVLENIGVGSVAESERSINDSDHERGQRFANLVDRCAETDEWEFVLIASDGADYVMRMKKVAEIPEYDAMAALVILGAVH